MNWSNPEIGLQVFGINQISAVDGFNVGAENFLPLRVFGGVRWNCWLLFFNAHLSASRIKRMEGFRGCLHKY